MWFKFFDGITLTDKNKHIKLCAIGRGEQNKQGLILKFSNNSGNINNNYENTGEEIHEDAQKLKYTEENIQNLKENDNSAYNEDEEESIN